MAKDLNFGVPFFKTIQSSKNNNGSGGGNGGSSSSGNKKRRKSRTAFTNKQIFELEKRFVYQKYLTPVDRDEIAQALGLSNAQVITWFQNRRAKLKRDMEELKADVIAAKSLGKEVVGGTLVGGIEELLQGTCETLKKKAPIKSSQQHQQQSLNQSQHLNHNAPDRSPAGQQMHSPLGTMQVFNHSPIVLHGLNHLTNHDRRSSEMSFDSSSKLYSPQNLSSDWAKHNRSNQSKSRECNKDNADEDTELS
ncbi:hypothetical protein HELRODRAFT_174136 [Helobdella robusta]|uniref:Homeobox domain-containing protein n=1 Tax=Helobdella robusta TaxID=6412 RepID=T1F7P0_HELRO|nr:hypothetical protein HELRODRAFT_174136 [Helobdella robusta]ESO03234.1 hypothetical protein HELRODRAFT_174136 [Helobdella robusta]